LTSSPRHRVHAWIALFAVWLNLALAQGHMHAVDVWGPLGHPVTVGNTETALGADPRQDPGLLATDNDCAVCLAMAIAGAGRAAVEITLAAPRVGDAPAFLVGESLPPSPRPFAPSLPRAPPV